MFLRALLDTGSGYFSQGARNDALEHFTLLTSAGQAQNLKGPIMAIAHYNMAVIHKKSREYLPAVKMLEKAVEYGPKYKEAQSLRAILMSMLGFVDEALQVPVISEPFSLPREGGDRISNESCRRMLMDLNYSCKLSRDEVSRRHLDWGKDVRAFLGPAHEYPPSRDDDPDRRLRIGYISPDFRLHVVAFFMEAVLRHRNRDMFNVTLYYSGSHPEDEVSGRLRGLADAWTAVGAMTPEQVLAGREGGRGEGGRGVGWESGWESGRAGEGGERGERGERGTEKAGEWRKREEVSRFSASSSCALVVWAELLGYPSWGLGE